MDRKFNLFLALLLWGILVPVASLFAQTHQAGEPLRSSFELLVPVPPSPLIVEGRTVLHYELHLTNFSFDTLALKRIEVRDEIGKSVAVLKEGALAKNLGWVGRRPESMDKRIINPGTRAIAYLDFTLKSELNPKTLKHHIEYEVMSNSGEEPIAAYMEGASIQVNDETLPVVGPPLRGGPWVALHHPSWERGHRRVPYALDGRAVIPGRFAIDWVMVNKNGRGAEGDADQVANWYGHGADVLAVADAMVVGTRDDLDESATLSGRQGHPLVEATGNYIALDLGKGKIAFYEHLKPGSVGVAIGDHVQRGQIIASVGFSGSAGNPQLHFHLADTNAHHGAEGLPYLLEAFELLGSYTDSDIRVFINNFGRGLTWQPRNDTDNALHAEEFPGPNVVVMFPNEEK